MKPEISIVVPFYNRIGLLKKTIQSILNQTYDDWELILVDDGSEQDISAYLSELNNKKVKLLRRKRTPKGAGTCRNIGAQHSLANFILFLDSDDLLAPWALEERLKFISNNPGSCLYIFEGMEFDNKHPQESRLRSIRKIKDPLKGFLDFESVWQTSCVVWKKETFHLIKGWDEGVKSWQDGEIHIRFLLTGMPYMWGNDLPDVFIRKHEDINRISNRKDIEKYINLYHTYIKVAVMLKEHQSLKKYFEKNIKNMLFTFVEGFDKELLTDYQNWIKQRILSSKLQHLLIQYIRLFKTFNNSTLAYKILYQIRKTGIPNKRKLFWSVQPTLNETKKAKLFQLLKNDDFLQQEIAFLNP